MAERPFSSRPLYLQVRDILAERIVKGKWKPGTAIPNEGDLAREFGLSQGTLRKALGLLEGERLITRRQGRGTFVVDQSSAELANRFTGIHNMKGDRIIDEVRLAEAVETVASDMECERLGLSAEESVFRIRQVRFADDKPFMVVRACVPASLFPDFERIGGDAGRIVSLAQQYGIHLGAAEERISITVASKEIAEALSIRSGTPIAALDRLIRAQDGRPVEWRLAWCTLSESYYLAVMP